MSKSDSENFLGFSRRHALLSATAGVAAVAATASSSDVTTVTAAGASCSTPRSAVAKTQYGKVRGYVEDGVLTFKGVPYGANTGGENRWLPAKPPSPWDGEYPRPLLWRQLPATPAHLDERTDVPLPVDRRLAERGHAEGEHLDA